MGRHMKKFWILAIISVFSLWILSVLEDEEEKKIVINEVCSRNIYLHADEEGDYYDWIELYNTGDKDILLDGYELTDKRENVKSSDGIFEDVVIKAHDYLVVYLTNTIYSDGDNGIYADFQISSKGESIYLLGSNEKIVDEVKVPALDANISYARKTDGAEQWVKKEPTPGSTNDIMPEYLKPGETNKIIPVFSAESGFYQEPFEVFIETAEAAEIYYTLDGSVPDKNAIMYEGGIWVEDVSSQPNVYSMREDTSALFLTDNEWVLPEEPVDKATVIRAVAYDYAGYPSEIVTATYFVGFDDKKEYEDISVMSLVTDPYNLFDYDHGIYVLGRTYDTSGRNREIDDWVWKRANYRNAKKESEREVHLDFFGEDKKLCLSKECGIRIKGGGSRAFVQKSFNLYARNEYDGTDEFEYNFWDEDVRCRVATLFTGGDDEISRIKDYLANSSAKGLNFASMMFRPCAVFIDGEYWGLYYLTEKYDAKYINEHYGVDEKDVAIIKNWTVEEGTDEDLEQFLSDIEYIETEDMAIPENYEEACRLMDMESLIDYFAFQLYIARYGDWLNGGGGNFACWKSKNISDGEYGDGKWRWMLFDVNSGSMDEGAWNTYEYMLEECDVSILSNLMNNEEFKQKFLKRQNEIREQIFAPDKIVPVIENMALKNKLPVLKTYDRFYGGIYKEEDYEREIQGIVDFYQRRYGYIMTMYSE